MIKFILHSALIIVVLFTVSCTFTSTRINNEADNDDGKDFLGVFYYSIGNKNFNAVDTLVSDSLKKIAGADGVSKIVKFINKKAGAYKGYDIVDHYITHISGSINETGYNYKLIVSYEKGIVNELVTLRKEGYKPIRMIGYHAYSNLFIDSLK